MGGKDCLLQLLLLLDNPSMVAQKFPFPADFHKTRVPLTFVHGQT